MPDEIAEQNAAMIRAGLWALFAAASLHAAAPPRPNDTHTSPADRAGHDADTLLLHFNARFPLDEMLAE